MRRAFTRSLSSLKRIFQFIDEYQKTSGIPDTAMFPMRFAAEEIFTNMVKYNASGKGEIELEIDSGDGRLIFTFTDHADAPFDITQLPEVDITRPLEELQPGGLGIHLTKKLMDEVRYSFEDGKSTTTLVKNLRKE